MNGWMIDLLNWFLFLAVSILLRVRALIDCAVENRKY